MATGDKKCQRNRYIKSGIKKTWTEVLSDRTIPAICACRGAMLAVDRDGARRYGRHKAYDVLTERGNRSYVVFRYCDNFEVMNMVLTLRKISETKHSLAVHFCYGFNTTTEEVLELSGIDPKRPLVYCDGGFNAVFALDSKKKDPHVKADEIYDALIRRIAKLRRKEPSIPEIIPAVQVDKDPVKT